MTFVYQYVAGGCLLLWLTKQIKEKQKMTPEEVATDITGLSPVENGNITSMTNYTYSLCGMQQRMDDSNTFG